MKSRIIGALIIVGTCLPIIFLANNIIFTFAVTLMALISVKELVGAKKNVPHSVILVMYMCIMFMGWYSYSWGLFESHYYIILFVILLVQLVLFQNLSKYDFQDASVIFTMCFFLLASYNSLIYVKVNYSTILFFYPILVAVFADTAGYVGGRLFGKHKLIVAISPKKTIEGAIAATLVAGVFSFLYLKQLDYSIVQVIIISIVMVILSQIGDLVASSIKRTYDIKDYSDLIPGHGGILDRFDSILFNFIVISIIMIYV